ncbi:molybdate ABC transporter substrate-binding protein [Peribacillus sp.]|uniref:molybdate ABC transporter substrate-binding protein n=1 Tax=Peribacillus sp. TaxID=2675267 RepID=UPI00388F6566
MKKLYLIISILFVMVIGAGCSSDENSETKKKEATKQVDLTISAAASLQDALNDIKASFEKETPNVNVNFNFGASGALQQQISKGAPVDLFFSAAEDKFDTLVDEGLIDEKQGTDLVGNELVLVVSKESDKGIKTLEDVTKATKLSIGTPESVPAGQYALQTLKNSGLWEEVEENVIYAKDVRQVLTYVETENVDAGMVYKTDALTSSKVDIVATAGEDLHDPIIYPAGVIKDSSHPKEAQLFYDYLQTEEAMKIFEEYGFTDVK